MTTEPVRLPRHRFGGYTLSDACGSAEGFSGENVCMEPYGRAVHYSDADHPFAPGAEFPMECSWHLQEGAASGVCCGDLGSPVHEASAVDQVISVGLGSVVRAAWHASKAIRPPDEDADARISEATLDKLAAEVLGDQGLPRARASAPVGERAGAHDQAHARTSERAGSGVYESASVGERTSTREDGITGKGDGSAVDGGSSVRMAWQDAVEALGFSVGQVLSGPWPVRKFIVGNKYEWHDNVEELLRSLGQVGETFSVESWIVPGTLERCVLVTWGGWYGLGLEALADEIAAAYDRA